MLNSGTALAPSSAFTIGHRYGSHLGDYDEGLRLAEQPVRDRVAQEEQQLLSRVATAESRFHGAQSMLDRARIQWERAQAQLDRLSRARDEARPEFSPRKGAIYLFISLALVIGDMAIVGMVMAQAFGFNWRIEDNLTYIGQLFSDPAVALSQQPELLFLALGIILIGMFVKVLRDAYLGAVVEPEGPRRRLRRAEFWVAVVFFAFSVLTLLAVAALRGDFGVMEPAAGQAMRAQQSTGFGLEGWASALIGFTLPFIAAGFFIKGYDCLGNSLAYHRAWLHEWWTSRMYVRQRTDSLHRQGEFEELRTRRADCASPEHLNGMLSACREQYETGYQSGLRDLLGDAGTSTMYDALQPIALQRILARRT